MGRGPWNTSVVPVDSRPKISRGIPQSLRGRKKEGPREEEKEEEEEGPACGKSESPALRDDRQKRAGVRCFDKRACGGRVRSGRGGPQQAARALIFKQQHLIMFLENVYNQHASCCCVAPSALHRVLPCVQTEGLSYCRTTTTNFESMNICARPDF